MKISLRVAIAALLVTAACSTTVIAQPPEGAPAREGRGRGGRGGPEMMMRMMPVMAALDADHDGTISKSEIDNAAVALRTLDKNNDGSLTIDELRPERPMNGQQNGQQDFRSGQFMTQMFENRDADKDGKLTGEELPPQMAGRLERIDTDGDGAVSKAEMKAVMERMQTGGGGRQGGNRQGGDRGGEPGGDRPRRPAAE